MITAPTLGFRADIRYNKDMTDTHKVQPERVTALARAPRLGLITDMDGTISPLVLVPDDAEVTARSRDLLAGLEPLLTLVAVISGREVADVRRRVGLDALTYIGNHGLEQWHDGQVQYAPEALPYRESIEQVIAALDSLLLPGMQLEDKIVTLSIHYRRAHDPTAAEALAAPLRALAQAQGLAFFEGKRVFELRPPLEIDKGTAFMRLVDEHRLDAAIFMGDDTTDADALRAARDLRAAGVCDTLALGVASEDTPAAVRASADVLVQGVSSVEDFLDELLKARRASSN